MRIYFTGAHSTGKTTLARHVSEAKGLPLLTEVARTILAEMELTLPQVHSNLDTVDKFQRSICNRQIELEKTEQKFVSDRCFDFLAYTAAHSRIAWQIARQPMFTEYLDWLKLPEAQVFFVRPHKELVREDGLRIGTDWGSVCRIDGMIEYILESNEIPYIPLASLSLRDRWRTVDRFYRLAHKK